MPAANAADAEFPIQNLPFAVFRPRGSSEAARCGVGIGDHILDVGRCIEAFVGEARSAAEACRAPVLNTLMALGPRAHATLRAQLSQWLAASATQHRDTLAAAMHAIDAVELQMPVRVGGFTDFFASVHHATNAGRLFRPDAPLLPNYKHVPIAYNGRANSVRVSGAPVQRPWGQTRPAGQAEPGFAPSQRLDHEVELGLYVGAPTGLGAPVPVGRAWDHIFGFGLLNDWSARDLQAWEYQPLGPFLAKSFATTVSPWVVTAEALRPFHTAAAPRAPGDPHPLPYLMDTEDQARGGLRIQVDCHLRSAAMRAQGVPAQRLSRSDTATLYWSFAQMVAHHTSNGSALDTGDLLGSGTISGDGPEALGSLLEITSGGARPLRLEATGEERTFLQDGDEVVLSGRCMREGYVAIGFGRCAGTLLPAQPRHGAQ